MGDTSSSHIHKTISASFRIAFRPGEFNIAPTPRQESRNLTSLYFVSFKGVREGVLRGILRHGSWEEEGSCRKLSNEELHDFCRHQMSFRLVNQGGRNGLGM
jgi:hypothetical protein